MAERPGLPRPVAVYRRAALLTACLAAGCLAWPPAPEPPPASPRPGPPPGYGPAGGYDPGVLEHLTLAAANEARVAHGLQPLRPDDALTDAARYHSADLARAGRISHTGTDGSSAATRATRAGARYRALGENLYRSTLFVTGTTTVGPGGVTTTYDWSTAEALARDAVEAWLASPGHRANLLHAAFRRAGTGVALDGERRWIVTMAYAD